jgi:hypothetical protein
LVEETDILKNVGQIKINASTQALKDIGVGGFGTKKIGIGDTKNDPI